MKLVQNNICDASDRLRAAGLRPTRQRVSLASLLFTGSDRHVSAEELHEEAVSASVPVSLATVYNTLNQFTDAGLLREGLSMVRRVISTPTPQITIIFTWSRKAS